MGLELLQFDYQTDAWALPQHPAVPTPPAAEELTD